jgi:hypothetical protein
MEKVMKKVSLVGVVLGAMLGPIASLLAGGWLFWLGVGLAVGLVVGSAQARRVRVPSRNIEPANFEL